MLPEALIIVYYKHLDWRASLIPAIICGAFQLLNSLMTAPCLTRNANVMFLRHWVTLSRLCALDTTAWLPIMIQQRRIVRLRFKPKLDIADRERCMLTLRAGHWIAHTGREGIVELIHNEVAMDEAEIFSRRRYRSTSERHTSYK